VENHRSQKEKKEKKTRTYCGWGGKGKSTSLKEVKWGKTEKVHRLNKRGIKKKKEVEWKKEDPLFIDQTKTKRREERINKEHAHINPQNSRRPSPGTCVERGKRFMKKGKKRGHKTQRDSCPGAVKKSMVRKKGWKKTLKIKKEEGQAQKAISAKEKNILGLPPRRERPGSEGKSGEVGGNNMAQTTTPS